MNDTQQPKTTRKAVLHNFDAPGGQYFHTLAGALSEAREKKVTGYIVDPSDSVIELRRGKRKATDGKWVAA